MSDWREKYLLVQTEIKEGQMYQLSKYTYIFRRESKVLLYNPIFQRKFLCKNDFFEEIEKKLGKFCVSSENLNKELKKLYTLGFLIRENQNRETKILKGIRSIVPPNRQELWFHLTENCSGNCYYCRQRKVENPKKKDLKPSDALDALDIFLTQVNKDRLINFVFYGGEPILNFKVIKIIVKKIEEDNRIERYELNLLTNGQ